MDSPLPPNPYKTLNVAQDAPLATIKSAHRKLVLTCHPDKFQDEAVKVQKQEQFHEVQQAYEILCDETKRQHYDERVKLAELRAEMMKEKGGSRIPQEYGSRPEFSSRPRPSPVFETRDGQVFQEIFPPRAYEEDVFSNNFQEHRSTQRRYDDRYSPPPLRRSSARGSEEKRRARDDDERYLYTKQSMKAAEKTTKHSQEKRKDRDKRKEREAKFTSKSPYVEDYDSDSDATEPYHLKATSRRRHDDGRRREREEPRRSSRRESSDHSIKLDKQTQNVEEYIKQKRDAAPPPMEAETRRPSQANRTFSTADFETRLPHSFASTTTPAEGGRRPSGVTREVRKGSPVRLARHMTEIVDPPTRRPSMPGPSSDPRPLKHMIPPKKEPLRASTMSHPFMRRSDTMPVSQGPRRAETVPIKPKTKNSDINDSGYSSLDAPEQYPVPTPSFRRTRTYQVSPDDDDPGRHNLIYVEPGDRDRDRDRDWDRERERDRDRDRDRERDRDRDRDRERDRVRDRDRERDISPRPRRQTDRPVMASRPSSNARGPPPLSNTFAYSTESVPSSRVPPTRAESNRALPPQSRQPSRGSQPLYGEFVIDKPYKIVHESPRTRANDILLSRRQSPEEISRDSYPGSHFEPRHRPSLARNEKAY